MRLALSERRRIAHLDGLEPIAFLHRVDVEEATAGDIVCISGMDELFISDTLCDQNNVEAMKPLTVDEPTVSMTFQVNDSPFAGKDGKFVTSRNIKDRLDQVLALGGEEGRALLELVDPTLDPSGPPLVPGRHVGPCQQVQALELVAGIEAALELAEAGIIVPEDIDIEAAKADLERAQSRLKDATAEELDELTTAVRLAETELEVAGRPIN